MTLAELLTKIAALPEVVNGVHTMDMQVCYMESDRYGDYCEQLFDQVDFGTIDGKTGIILR